MQDFEPIPWRRGLLRPTCMQKWCNRHPAKEGTVCKIPGLRRKCVGT